ncbi:hypothetical protein MPDQ_005184 [Monascus purpureus]|uniref:Uncharacterized protein n=1 Tax=Monascus purpureus TaxID=5098 RepID=A0A507QGD0_MONPU|nr:hypothetical protein MPDQ_005184 [Monascus purpureus]BDD62127.1 hypothetical protein MAP00_007117 [Monascus purpureus]
MDQDEKEYTQPEVRKSLTEEPSPLQQGVSSLKTQSLGYPGSHGHLEEIGKSVILPQAHLGQPQNLPDITAAGSYSEDGSRQAVAGQYQPESRPISRQSEDLERTLHADAKLLTAGTVAPEENSAQWMRNAEWLPHDDPTQRDRQGPDVEQPTKRVKEQWGSRPVTQFEFPAAQNILQAGQDGQYQAPPETMVSEQEAAVSQDAVAVTSSTRPDILTASTMRKRQQQRELAQSLGIKAVYKKKRQSMHSHLTPDLGESAAVQYMSSNTPGLGSVPSEQLGPRSGQRPVTQIHFQNAEPPTLASQQLPLPTGGSPPQTPLPPDISSREVPEVFLDEEESIGMAGKQDLSPRKAREAAGAPPGQTPQAETLGLKHQLPKSTAKKS